MISDRKRELLTKIGRQFLVVVLVFLIISANQSNLSVDINTSFAKISIQKLYAVFVLSVSTGLVLLEIIGYFNLNEYQRIVSGRMLKFDNSQVRSLFYDGAPAWSHVLNVNYRFFDGGSVYRIFVTSAAILTVVPLVVVFFMIYQYSIGFILKYIIGYGYIPFGDVLSIIALMMLFFPLVVAAVVFTPVAYLKNKRFIRWNFLFAIHKRSNLVHPQAISWLDDQRAPKIDDRD